jgi:UDP-N-acetylmuramate dehydrogenase
MQEKYDVPLSSSTTLRLGGPARRFLSCESKEEIIQAVQEADAQRTPLLLLGGGSNVVIADAGFQGTVLHVASRGVQATNHGDDVLLDVAAGEPWDDLCARAVADGLSGIECLSGIPGLAGAVPMQNVGAYGQDVSSVVQHVVTFDRERGAEVVLPAAACGFGYRSSIFRGSSRYVLTGVRFRLRRSTEARVPAYAELLRALSIQEGDHASLSTLRETVVRLRRGKGMVLDPDDPESVSAGSFFTNVVVTEAKAEDVRAAAALGPGEAMPRFADAPGMVKLSAAWLIERAGFPRGTMRGNVGTSRKHSLALVNRGGTARELVALAVEIRNGVRARFGVTISPEPIFVGLEWPEAP